jgi:integrase
MSLHDSGGRKYLNIAERRRFIQAADQAELKTRLFCLLLAWSGCRISEALATVPSSLDFDSGVIEFETLKRRQRGFVRQVPLPTELLRELNCVFKLEAAQRDPVGAKTRLWNWSRSTAWRHVKKVMDKADLHGSSAMPKGLRHAFGVAAFNAVPPHLVQRWLGHASLRTTAIYGDVSGPEERSFAERLWQRW